MKNFLWFMLFILAMTLMSLVSCKPASDDFVNIRVAVPHHHNSSLSAGIEYGLVKDLSIGDTIMIGKSSGGNWNYRNDIPKDTTDDQGNTFVVAVITRLNSAD
jgi:ABC-type uncharacterized transport system substrate-binding protein